MIPLAETAAQQPPAASGGPSASDRASATDEELVGRAWAAGFVDADGAINTWTRRDGRRQVRVTVRASSRDPLEQLREIFGSGTVRDRVRRRPELVIEGRRTVGRALLLIEPYLRVRGPDARRVLAELRGVERPRCLVPDCDRPMLARRLCSTHYPRAHRAGLLAPTTPTACVCCGEHSPTTGPTGALEPSHLATPRSPGQVPGDSTPVTLLCGRCAETLTRQPATAR
jgi:hypothetical protein